MSFPANVIRVMIASPSDVKDERLIVRDVIDEWNAVNSCEKCLVLTPAMWELDSYPATGAHPQEIINAQVLADCDLLVAIFWTRLGAGTKSAPSGTVEEIQRHEALGKPAMLYFSEASYPSNVDTAQVEAVRKYRVDRANDSLFCNYSDIHDFRVKFSRHLAKTIDGLTVGMGLKQIKTIPELSDRARRILADAFGAGGEIMMIPTMQHLRLQVKGISYISERNPREEAAWKYAMSELEAQGYIEAVGTKREIFHLTEPGYQFVESETLGANE